MTLQDGDTVCVSSKKLFLSLEPSWIDYLKAVAIQSQMLVGPKQTRVELTEAATKIHLINL